MSHHTSDTISNPASLVNLKDVEKWTNDPRFVARMKAKPKISFNYSIPYLAGYSKDGRTVFFDKNFKPRMTTTGFDTTRTLLVHEMAEKALIDLFGLTYQQAHNVATYLEWQAVKAQGANWLAYSKFLAPQITRIGETRVTNPPAKSRPHPL